MAISPTYPVILQDGTLADANQVMANFYQIQNDVNTNAAHNGANSDITSLLGLTTPLPISEGGTGASTAAQALINLGVTALLAALVVPPVGSIVMWPSVTPPSSFFECNGQAVSRTTYASLFAVCGTTFGAGDGATTFNIPDLRGYFPRGWDDSAGVDSGRALGTIQQDQFQTHGHAITDPGHRHAVYSSVNDLLGGPNNVDGVDNTSGTPNGDTDVRTTGIAVTTPNSGNTGSETRPKNVSLMFCIRYQ